MYLILALLAIALAAGWVAQMIVGREPRPDRLDRGVGRRLRRLVRGGAAREPDRRRRSRVPAERPDRVDPRRRDRHRGVGTGARPPNRLARPEVPPSAFDGSSASSSVPCCSSRVEPRPGALSSPRTRWHSSGGSMVRATGSACRCARSCRRARSGPSPPSRSSPGCSVADDWPRAWPWAARWRGLARSSPSPSGAGPDPKGSSPTSSSANPSRATSAGSQATRRSPPRSPSLRARSCPGPPRPVLIGVVGTVGLGRMYVGAHLPHDIVGGAGLGMMISAVIPPTDGG